jgi:hypothetical protein
MVSRDSPRVLQTKRYGNKTLILTGSFRCKKGDGGCANLSYYYFPSCAGPFVDISFSPPKFAIGWPVGFPGLIHRCSLHFYNTRDATKYSFVYFASVII